MSWFDKPAVVVSAADRRRLARLHVTVAVPVYNEDPGLLDRCRCLVISTGPLTVIWVVDDGSQTDYAMLRQYWERTCREALKVAGPASRTRGSGHACSGV